MLLSSGFRDDSLLAAIGLLSRTTADTVAGQLLDVADISLAELTEELVLQIAQGLAAGRSIMYQGWPIDLTPPWERLTVADAFTRLASVDGQSMAYVFADEGDAKGTVVSRFFFPSGAAILEDPATGSACANLGGWFCALRPGEASRLWSPRR